MGAGNGRGPGAKRKTNPGAWLDYVKLGLVVVIAGVYSYALFLQPLRGTDPPHWPVLGSPLTRLAGVALRPAATAAATHCGVPLGVMWPNHLPGGGVVGIRDTLFADPAVPVTTGRLYGAVPEADLPWYGEPPARLNELRAQTGADRLVAAFRTTLPNPIWDEAANVARGAEYLAGTVVNPGEAISLIGVIGPFTKTRGYGDGPGYANNRVVATDGGGVCKIATALYNALVHSDLQVLERKPHSMLVPYVPPGRDAAIATGSKDVRFRNDKAAPIVLWAAMRDTTLFVAVYGDYDAPVIEWFHEESNRHKAQPIRRANPNLPSGTEQLVIEGYDGVTVRTWILIKRANEPDERRDMSVDTYRPLPGVIEYGP